jgi:hypothetical protein
MPWSLNDEETHSEFAQINANPAIFTYPPPTPEDGTRDSDPKATTKPSNNIVKMLKTLITNFDPVRKLALRQALRDIDTLPADQKIEEETLPTYRPNHFYPVTVGQEFNDRYRVICKLGYGGSSTV